MAVDTCERYARDLGQVGDLLAKDAAATDLQIYPGIDAAIAAL